MPKPRMGLSPQLCLRHQARKSPSTATQSRISRIKPIAGVSTGSEIGCLLEVGDHHGLTAPRHHGRQKKTDVADHPQVFGHVGLLFSEPPGFAGLLYV